MTIEAWLQEALVSPRVAGPMPVKRGDWPHARLVKAASSLDSSAEDLAVLLRAVIRSESIERGFSWRIPLPTDFRDRIVPAFDKAGLKFDLKGTVYAMEWHPHWLANSSDKAVDASVRPTQRRPQESCGGDPILSVLGLSDYTSGAQRDAVRTVFCAWPGETVAVCLPTGSGKSLCAFLPSLLPMHGETDAIGISIIVVPTVALALDLEERMEASVGHPIAYRPEKPEEAEQIRARCEAGVQGPLLVSPESLGGNLLKSLQAAARKGSLRYFVIDEAHMTLAWGDEFRPAFLRLAAVRRILAKQTERGFITLLLSATLTDYHLRSLETMFSESGQFRILHAARLRPEPSFWMARAPDEATRMHWVEEAIFRVPRPAIVYTTKRDECVRWHARFRELGFRRVGMMTGDTPDHRRRHLLKAWNADEIDLIVATSAFGLGVDKRDVRTILHAQLPESVDRFYQDVGRAGRDGNASLSLLITTPTDWPKVAGLGKARFISTQFGVERWKRMYQQRTVVGAASAISLVNLHAGRKVDMQGDYNRNWNLRTLQLLQRANAIEFVGHEQETSNRVAIRTNAVHHQEPFYWESTISNLRAELSAGYARAGRFLERLGRMERECISNLFADCYEGESFGLSVVKACGGCPACRAEGKQIFCGRMLARRVPSDPPEGHFVGEDLRRLLTGRPLAMITYPSGGIHEAASPEAEELLWWLATQGVCNFVVPDVLNQTLGEIAGRSRHLKIFRHARPPLALDVTARQATVVYLTYPEPAWWPEFYLTLSERQTPTVLIAPENQRCPVVKTRVLREAMDCPVYGWTECVHRFVA